MPPIITFTSDFEEREPYAASVKGVLHTRCPGVQIVDLSHDIPRQSVTEGTLFIAGAVPYFPPGTIHMVAIASGAQPIAVMLNEQVVICPDNGVLSLLAERFPIQEAHAITNPDLDLSEGGQTYFARDVFAPTAALLAGGASLSSVGEPVEKVARLDLPKPEQAGSNLVQGQVIHINRFGSLVSNIHRSFLEGTKVVKISAGDFPVGPLSNNYSDVASGRPLALYGSSGYLEIAYNNDRADTRLDMGIGIIVNVETVQPT